MRVHYFTQRGHSQRKIAENLDISLATVRSDQQLVESHWSSIAGPAADDLLLESLHLLHLRLSLAISEDQVAKLADRLTPVEYLRARETQETHLTSLAREIRSTVADVHRRTAQRSDQPELYEEQPQEIEKTITESAEISHPKTAISSPEQEIVSIGAKEENSPLEPAQLPEPTPIDTIINDAIELFPQLKGQSEDQILAFLDQFTNPNPIIYAEAAGG
jgi:hypothetical protein